MISLYITGQLLSSLMLLSLVGYGISVPTGLYDFPEPTVEVFKNGGFKISIPDEVGISLFAFHGNINQKLRNLEAGQISVDIIKKENNRWTYDNSDIKLKRGDVINYWLYVIKNGLGYQLLDKQYTVVDYTDESSCSVIYNTGVGNCMDQIKSLDTCMKIQSNILQTLVLSQNELNRLQRLLNSNVSDNDNNTGFLASADEPAVATLGFAATKSTTTHSTTTIPSTTLEPVIDVSGYKNALLIGGNLPNVIPTQQNYVQLINFILWEKLELHNTETVSVTPQGADTYVFELLTALDKQKVLDASKTKLTDSTIYVRNYEK